MSLAEYLTSQRTASPGGSALAVLWCWSCYEHNSWHRLGETGMGDGGKSTAARKCQPIFPLTTVGFRRVCAWEEQAMASGIFDKMLLENELQEPISLFEKNSRFQSTALRG